MKMLSKKDRYRLLTESDQYDGSIFSEAWWLDVSCGEDKWDVCLSEKNGEILGALPFYIKTVRNHKIICQPPFTQNLGPWVKQVSSRRNSNKLAFEKDVFFDLIEQLPAYDLFAQCFHPARTNWLPFYWKGFSQTTFYTYVLVDLHSDLVWEGLQSNIKTDINKSKNRFGLTIKREPAINDLSKLIQLTFGRQSKSMPQPVEYIEEIVKEAISRNRGKILIAQDGDGRNHAGAFIIWDKSQAYYLLGGGDPELRNSGAGSLCLHEAIAFSSSVTKSFDFEGSMVESIERYFRAFGGRQTPYFHVSKYNSRLLKARHLIGQSL